MTASSTPTPLRLGTRASALASTQSNWVADKLRAVGHEVELVMIRTVGDTSRASLTEIGGTGVFASALREALREGTIDLAVHSLKDIPTWPEPDLVITAIPEREDPRDVIIARDGLTLESLPAGASIGTGSPRRAAQLRQLRPDLVIKDIRGNVGTRINFVRSGELDAILLARAGLARLGQLDEATQILELDTMLPAPGQGALAVECREDATELRELLSILEHAPTRAAVEAERAVLNRLEAGCTAPIAAHAAYPPGSDELTLSVFMEWHDSVLRHQATGPVPVALGRTAAEDMLSRLDLTDTASTADGQPAAGVVGSSTPERDL